MTHFANHGQAAGGGNDVGGIVAEIEAGDAGGSVVGADAAARSTTARSTTWGTTGWAAAAFDVT
jgi:hypothetical protein